MSTDDRRFEVSDDAGGRIWASAYHWVQTCSLAALLLALTLSLGCGVSTESDEERIARQKAVWSEYDSERIGGEQVDREVLATTVKNATREAFIDHQFNTASVKATFPVIRHERLGWWPFDFKSAVARCWDSGTHFIVTIKINDIRTYSVAEHWAASSILEDEEIGVPSYLVMAKRSLPASFIEFNQRNNLVRQSATEAWLDLARGIALEWSSEARRLC